MKKIVLLIAVSLSPFFIKAQTLGGYPIYDHLATAIHPYGCIATYVTEFPDDSIWVNFADGDSMTGTFNNPSIDATGDDLLLETGFHTANYVVSLLLSNGQYSASHNVVLTDWTLLPNIGWEYLFTSCGTGVQLDEQHIVPLDFSQDFGLSSTDTVTGIKIIFLYSAGATDFAGAYIINPQNTGINEQGLNQELSFSPNPFSDEINIKMSGNDFCEISLYDITSRKLLLKQFTGSVSLNVSELSKGIYIYEVRNKNGTIKKGKVLKE